ncbi:MAG: tRNA uridine-5-carboxymethylaminomethyl(34) synthesis GTPase MnmE [Candidatus Omnitrophica bacterium]|nr:tRNA uridine-5-carboxymethylaminomethyl(34) synthesis GTPase MnmE [Candidatus Omnitrophota bacterium]
MNLIKLKDYNTNDTIAAIATFPAPSALGVIKISGKNSLPIISKIFLPKNKKNIKKAKTYTIHYGWIIGRPQTKDHRPKTKKAGKIIDEVLVSVMRAPGSYTKEDVVEISSHGGAIVLNKILEVILKTGARLALPGEFSYRALTNGRIDLLQAQSIADIVGAKSEEGLGLATKQLLGSVSRKLEEVKEDLKELYAHTEAAINFPEETADIRLDKLRQRLSGISKAVEALLTGANEARIFQEGLRCVICGKTNAGKSTLFNCLLRDERVIVSHIPGTTRDVIEETISIEGIPLRIYDTAGILEPADLITEKALEKTSKAFEQADLILAVFDGSRPFDKDDKIILDKLKNLRIQDKSAGLSSKKKIIFIINKNDLASKLHLKEAARKLGRVVYLSALKNKGIKGLEQAIARAVYKGSITHQDCIFLSQMQKNALAAMHGSLLEALTCLNKHYTVDFLHLSLRQALDDASRISGEIISEEILESIFSRFCIGK